MGYGQCIENNMGLWSLKTRKAKKEPTNGFYRITERDSLMLRLFLVMSQYKIGGVECTYSVGPSLLILSPVFDNACVFLPPKLSFESLV